MRINLKERNERLVTIRRCDYYQYLKCYCLSFPDSSYPHGIQEVSLSPFLNTDIISFLVAPENFYDFSRKLNKLEFQYGFGFEYIVRYDIHYQLLDSVKKPCRQNLSWAEDTCKIEKVERESVRVP